VIRAGFVAGVAIAIWATVVYVRAARRAPGIELQPSTST
jgi:hypothetical protein